MRNEGGRFARLRDAWMLRRILDTRDGGAVGKKRDAEDADGAGAERDAATAGMKRGRVRSAIALDTLMVEAFRTGGTSLPPSERAAFYRESLAAAAEKARSELIEGSRGAGELRVITGGEAVEGAAPRRRILTLPRLAVACFVVLALLAGMGFASTYAMPGSPLYSVKRAIEKARFVFTSGGESEANLLIAYAERRIDELEYAGERDLTGWYASLAMDASRDLLKALAETGDLPDDKAAAIRSHASDLLRRLESLLLVTLEDIPPELSEELRQGTEEIREELWPEGFPPDWVDPWADQEDQEKPVEPVSPVPSVDPVPPVTPDESPPPIELPVEPPAVPDQAPESRPF